MKICMIVMMMLATATHALSQFGSFPPSSGGGGGSCDPAASVCRVTCDIEEADLMAAVNDQTPFTCLAAGGANTANIVTGTVTFLYIPGANDYTWYGAFTANINMLDGTALMVSENAIDSGADDEEGGGFIDNFVLASNTLTPAAFANKAVAVTSVRYGRVTDAGTTLNSGGSGWMVNDTFEKVCEATNAEGVVDSVSMGAIVTFHWTAGGTSCGTDVNSALTPTGGSMGADASVDINAVETIACAMGDVCGSLRIVFSYTQIATN